MSSPICQNPVVPLDRGPASSSMAKNSPISSDHKLLDSYLKRRISFYHILFNSYLGLISTLIDRGYRPLPKTYDRSSQTNFPESGVRYSTNRDSTSEKKGEKPSAKELAKEAHSVILRMLDGANAKRPNLRTISIQTDSKPVNLINRIRKNIVDLNQKLVSLIVIIFRRIYWFLGLIGTVLKNVLPSKKWSHQIQQLEVEGKGHTLTLGGMPALRFKKPHMQYISMLEPYERIFIGKGVLGQTLHFPTPDFEVVSKETIQKAVKAVQKKLRTGDVYLHCKGGDVRSAVVAVAFKMLDLKDEYQDVDTLYKAAFDYVKQKRPQITTKTFAKVAKDWFNKYTPYKT